MESVDQWISRKYEYLNYTQSSPKTANNQSFSSSPTRTSPKQNHAEPALIKKKLREKLTSKILLENRNAYFCQYIKMVYLKKRILYTLIGTILCLITDFFLYEPTNQYCHTPAKLCSKSVKCMAFIGFFISSLICLAYYVINKFYFVYTNKNQAKNLLLGFTKQSVSNSLLDTPKRNGEMMNESKCQIENSLLKDVNCKCTKCHYIKTVSPKDTFKTIMKKRSIQSSSSPTSAMKDGTKSPIYFGSSPNNSSLISTPKTSFNCMLQQYSPNTSNGNTSFSLLYNTSGKENFINDKENLRDFLRSVRYNDSELKSEDPRNKIFFETPVYQFAPLPETQPTVPENDSNSITKVERKSHLLKDIKQERLVQFLANLRRWLSKTIIERLCHEFDKTNNIFKNTLHVDEQIGLTNIERLRKMSLDKEFVSRTMPNLPLLYRFLNLCPNQAYLVQRIRELATGTCIPEYSWKNNNLQLPSDAAILFHLFCVYMDSQLNPMPQGCSERPFHSQYVIMDDGKRSPKELILSLKNRAQCAIVCSGIYSPQFRFICNGEIQSSATGANNLFHVILYFLLYLRANNIFSLEGVSLGKQGINIACIIED